METRSQTRARLAQRMKTIHDFIEIGEPLHNKACYEESEDNEQAWLRFQREAQLELVLRGRDKKLRKDCMGCRRIWDDAEKELEECAECGDFKTYHYECHWCMVFKSICHV